MLSDKAMKTLKKLIPNEFWDANYAENDKIINACFNLGINSPEDIIQIIEFINTEAINLFLTKIINEFTPEQRAAFESFMETKPTPQEIITTLIKGFERKYKLSIKDTILAVREEFMQNFFTNLAVYYTTHERMQMLSKDRREELLYHARHGQILSFMLTLIES